MPFAVCLLKERKGSAITTKCGRTKGVVVADTTAWTDDVTCPKCLEMMTRENPTPDPAPPARRRVLRHPGHRVRR